MRKGICIRNHKKERGLASSVEKLQRTLHRKITSGWKSKGLETHIWLALRSDIMFIKEV